MADTYRQFLQGLANSGNAAAQLGLNVQGDNIDDNNGFNSEWLRTASPTDISTLSQLVNSYRTNQAGGVAGLTRTTPLPGSSIGGGGGGGGEPAKVFNQVGAENTQRTIDQIPGLLEAALATEGTRYGNVINDYNTEEQGQRKIYGTSTTTNQQNYDANFMDSIRGGIKGLGGLMQLLRGTGAAGGTAEDLARDAVGEVTANDIRGGADTQKENQTSLDSSLGAFLSGLQRKRQEAEDTRVNNERAVRAGSNTQLQNLFGQMAGFYGDVGNTAGANEWMNKAGALTPDIAANSRTQISPYDTTPVTVQAPQLAAFAAPTQPNVTTAPNGQIGSGIFTMTDPRRRKDIAAPVGA